MHQSGHVATRLPGSWLIEKGDLPVHTTQAFWVRLYPSTSAHALPCCTAHSPPAVALAAQVRHPLSVPHQHASWPPHAAGLPPVPHLRRGRGSTVRQPLQVWWMYCGSTGDSGSFCMLKAVSRQHAAATSHEAAALRHQAAPQAPLQPTLIMKSSEPVAQMSGLSPR